LKIDRVTQKFVTSFPDELEPGVLYVSLEYDTTLHLCACGCRNQVVLPLDPTGWSFTYDGKTITLSPSVGNWSFPCRSHYVIERGRIRWAPAWSYAQIVAGRKRTLRERGIEPDTGEEEPLPQRPTLWQRIKDFAKRVVSRGERDA
jgi:hypothetical protein